VKPSGGGRPHAVVIGSGIGGAAATLLLAHAGIRTTLIEKNRRLGGSCSGYEKQGFTIDIGTHMFSRGPAGPLGDVLRRVGSDGAIDFRRTKDIAELRFSAGEGTGAVSYRVPVPSELYRMPHFAFRLARALRLSVRDAARAARLFTRILTMTDAEVAEWNGRTVEDLVRGYVDHAPTIGVFGFLLGLYFILPYWEVSAGEAVWAFREMARDNWLSYPRGGSRAVPETYCRLAQSFGAEIRAGCGVRRIVVAPDSGSRGTPPARVRGVELEDGTVLPADLVVSTSSVRTTVMRLVGREHFPEAYAERAARIRGSYIAVQAKIGLRKKLVDAGAIVGGVGESVDLLHATTADMRAMFGAMASGTVPSIVPFYCPVPSNFDPELAPPGCQLLTVCAVAPTTDVALKDPGPVWEEAMLRAMRRVVPGLDESTLFVDRFSVEFIEKWIGKEFGPAVSTAQTPDQVGSKRPQVFTPIAGLYLAGCNAGGRGVGTELAAASAMECTDRILADLGVDLGGARRVLLARRPRRWLSRAATAPLAWAARNSTPPAPRLASKAGGA
jgi:phytoene dehydrogenase-like protein